MNRCRPKGWAESVGFQWPIPRRASGQRASSPRPDQGGIVKASCRPTSAFGSRVKVVAPQSDFDRRRFTTADAFANPTTPASAVADLLHDPHYRARGAFIEVQHPLGFRETIYGAYVKTSRSKVRVRPGPLIGQDNDYVFRGLLGLTEERYRKLMDEQVIY